MYISKLAKRRSFASFTVAVKDSQLPESEAALDDIPCDASHDLTAELVSSVGRIKAFTW
jgi:hypothetical protein